MKAVRDDAIICTGPDSFAIMQQLTAWARERVAGGGAPIKIRLVKGASTTCTCGWMAFISTSAWIVPRHKDVGNV